MKPVHRSPSWISLALCCGLLAAAPGYAGADLSVLVFSKTSGFRHGSIDEGIALVQQLGADNGFSVEATEDATALTPANLAQYGVVVWLNTTGDVLNVAQQAAFEGFIQNGGGYVGVHSATDTEYGWPWYGQLIGGDAWFQNHPSIQDATLNVVDAAHPSTDHLPASFTFRDEWYNFRNDPTPVVDVLLTLDETTYSGGTMGPGHPISWSHEFQGGRAWYTGLGHRDQTYADSDFRQHLLGGILWAASATDPGRTPPTMTVSPASGGALELIWGSSACASATDHAIYEGTIGSWASHQILTCTDAGGDLREVVVSSSGSRYYLVVPLNAGNEGSYGRDSEDVERPSGTGRVCRPAQALGCP